VARTAEEISRLIEHSRDLYRHAARVTQTADLHAAGFAQGRLQVLVPNGDRLDPRPIAAGTDLLEEIGVRLFVLGSAQANVVVDGDDVRLEPGDGCTFEFHEHPTRSEDIPPGAVWPVATRHDTIIQLIRNPAFGAAMGEQLPRLVSLYFGEMLPTQLLSTEAATRVEGEQIKDMLLGYRLTVQRMKEQFGDGLLRCLRASISVDAVAWEPDWSAPDSKWSSLVVSGFAYRAFKSQDVDLANLRDWAVGTMNEWAKLGVITRDEADGVTRAFEAGA
jgi:hypothetical protein